MVQLLPVIGIGGLLGVSAGIVTMGTAVVVGAGTAAGERFVVSGRTVGSKSSKQNRKHVLGSRDDVSDNYT